MGGRGCHMQGGYHIRIFSTTDNSRGKCIVGPRQKAPRQEAHPLARLERALAGREARQAGFLHTELIAQCGENQAGGCLCKHSTGPRTAIGGASRPTTAV
ncbi:Hypp5007 [Branchiostoma lanceolatum]|uniref:Hypp5007 protein n=1 Tax=Branchiostoma lanceolatum TaxID=7740 RepID=A0A8K0F008_BRALA|nr:Hypp5007 [Branchiostoma lanceolatum]